MLPEILGVKREDGGVSWVPLTPLTTFRDVAACVRDTGDPLPHLLEDSPLGVRVVAGWERPLELLRLWNTLKDQVSYTASYSHKDDPADPLAYLSKSSYLEEEEEEDSDPISPWELYDLKDELKDFGSELRPSLTSSGGDVEVRRFIFDDPPLSRSLDDSDELVVVSSDGEADSSYNSHTQSQRNNFVRSILGGRNGLMRHSNRSTRRPSANWPRGGHRQSGISPFVRGHSQTSSLPLKSQEVIQPPLHYPKERHPLNLQNSQCNGEVGHRKRTLPAHTIENGSPNYYNGHLYKYYNLQEDYNGLDENYMERMQWNKNLSPVISKKQKLRSTEHRQLSTKSGYGKIGSVENSKVPVHSRRGEAARPHQTSRAGHSHTNQSDIRHLLHNHFSSKGFQLEPLDIHQNGTYSSSSRNPAGSSQLRNSRNFSGRNLQVRNSSEQNRNPHALDKVHSSVVSHDSRRNGRDDPVNCRGDSTLCTNHNSGHQRHSQPQVQERSSGQRTSATHRSKSKSEEKTSGRQNGELHHSVSVPGLHAQCSTRGINNQGHESRPQSRFLRDPGNGSVGPRDVRESQGRRYQRTTSMPETRQLYPSRGGQSHPPLTSSHDRPSRRTATHRTVHRRSYSDPLYEYLKDDNRALHLRQPARRRRHSAPEYTKLMSPVIEFSRPGFIMLKPLRQGG
ncbi:uncharacterized protein LOC121875069 [Homarus americanus]|uniref:uncharacterized protein LOC121875069 n=1 Tax=Homarus americanus TaxID=6706 RepID=UPI001C43C2F5|nr:uncharacterized protein LOC121875069 [Homarus americanus]